MALEVALRDLAEDAGKASRNVAILGQIGGAQEVLADLRTRCRRHLLDADDEDEAGLASGDRLDPLVDRRRSGRAGVLHPRRRLEAKVRVGLEDESGGEILRRETGVEMPQNNLVDVLCLKAGIGDGLIGDAGDQRFDGFIAQSAERRMGPTHNRCSHSFSPGLEVLATAPNVALI